MSKKQAKSERERYSIFTNNLKLCYICKCKPKEHMHEIFAGRNRRNSMIYGLCLPVCNECHDKIQYSKEWEIIGQKAFMKHYKKTKDEFIKIFGRNYL